MMPVAGTGNVVTTGKFRTSWAFNIGVVGGCDIRGEGVDEEEEKRSLKNWGEGRIFNRWVCVSV
jgi:hypothetical protein